MSYKNNIRLLNIINIILTQEEYVKPPATATESRYTESSPFLHPPLMAWTPGWCDDVNMDIGEGDK